MLLVKLVIISVLLLLLSLFAHELGHYLYFIKVLHKKVRFYWCKGVVVGVDKDYEGLSVKQELSLLSWGVLFGFVVLFLGALMVNFEVIIWMFIPYLACCVSDLKNIRVKYLEYQQELLVKELVESVDELTGFRRLMK